MLNGVCDGALRIPGSEMTFQDPKHLNPDIHHLFILFTKEQLSYFAFQIHSAQVFLLLI